MVPCIITANAGGNKIGVYEGRLESSYDDVISDDNHCFYVITVTI